MQACGSSFSREGMRSWRRIRAAVALAEPMDQGALLRNGSITTATAYLFAERVSSIAELYLPLV